MPGTATCRRSVRCRSRGQRPHLQPHTTRRPTRLATSNQLMAQESGLVLPRLGSLPLVHRLVADDRLAVMLAKALVELGIAIPGDWKRAERDPTSFIRLTLERWIHTHGGSAILHRFLLSAVISNTPCEWAERDETKPNQLFLIVEPSEASCGCLTFEPPLKLLESVHPNCRRPPSTSLSELSLAGLGSTIIVMPKNGLKPCGNGSPRNLTLTSMKSRMSRAPFHLACGRKCWVRVTLLASRTT
jgi:hypothetical protein